MLGPTYLITVCAQPFWSANLTGAAPKSRRVFLQLSTSVPLESLYLMRLLGPCS